MTLHLHDVVARPLDLYPLCKFTILTLEDVISDTVREP